MLSISRHWIIIFLILICLLVFGLNLASLTQDSFWSDEAFSAWLVHDDTRPPESPRENVRFVRDSFLNTFDRVRDDVHPPLYYVFLDAWTLLAGDSEFILRFPSALMGLLALALSYTIAVQCFNRKTALIAVILLATSGFFLYYSREVRMYSLYLTLATMATAAYLRFKHQPTIKNSLLYGFIGALLLYTHYTSFTIILVHLLHIIFMSQNRRGITHYAQFRTWVKTILPFFIIAILFAPWIPFALNQVQLNTGFAAPGALSSDAGTIAALWLKLTSGYWGIFALIFVLSLLNFRKITFRPLILILLWIIIPPAILLFINARGLSIFQLRYVIAIIPAWSLLIAYGITQIYLPFFGRNTLRPYKNIIQNGLAIFFTMWIAYTQLATYRQFWPEKPDWRTSVQAAATTRHASEPALVYLDEKSPLAYYDRQFNLLQGISINISWRNFSPQEIQNSAHTLDNAESVWAIVAMQAPESWDAIAAFSQNRGISYRDSVQWTVFYRFDSQSDETLTFHFADLLAYRGKFYTEYSLSENQLCVPILLEALADIPESYSIGLHLTRGYNELVAQTDEGLGAYAAGDEIERELCVEVPENGTYHLRLVIYDWQTLERLPLLEGDLLWGDYLMLGTVTKDG